MRALSVLVVAALAALFLSTPAMAQNGGGVGGDSWDDDADTVTFVASNLVEGSGFGADVAAARPSPVYSTEPTCFSSFFVDGILQCLFEAYCYGERVDDLYTGRISGNQAGGAYGEYLSTVVGLFIDAGVLDANDPSSADSVSSALLTFGLADPPTISTLPVFSYCRDTTTGQIAIEPGRPYSPVFSWSTTAQDEYPITQIATQLVDELIETLHLNTPQIGSTPPAETGKTWVKFPMWFWLNHNNNGDTNTGDTNNNTENTGGDTNTGDRYLWAQSDLETIRLAAKATIDHVEWTLDNDNTLTCQPNDMRPYTTGTNPTTNIPKCSHTFEQTNTFELTATITYRIEQHISIRPSRLTPYPPANWQPHPTQPEIAITTTAGTITIGELHSLNTLTTNN